MADADPRLLLARRLRALREEQWPDLKITQLQLGQALGGEKKPLSVPLISSWESQTNPKIPPYFRLEGYAQLFATRRSFEGVPPRLVKPDDMDAAERQAMAELRQELGQLRTGALRAASGSGLGPVSAPLPTAAAGAGPIGASQPPAVTALDRVEAARKDEVSASLNTGPWRFRDGKTITVVCAQLPDNLRAADPYTDLDSPDYIQLYTYSELDALFELHGHLRAANPANQVDLRIASRLEPDEYTSHLVSLGGIDWNAATRSLLQELQLPVSQVANWGEDDVYFESDDGQKFRPELDETREKKILRFDVALFARAVNPYNKQRTVTICTGMYGRGTYGAVRALTDAKFRDRNTRYVNSRFGESSSYCIITRVPVVNGATITPDWTDDDFKLFEWSAEHDAGEW
jgi:hypothetical protein